MKKWVQIEPHDQHSRFVAKKRGKLIGVFEIRLHYLRGRTDLMNHTERPYDLLEHSVIRSLLELVPPPSRKQIATLLGFEDERFVMIVLKRLQEDKYLVVSATGIQHITQKLRDDFALKRWVEEESKSDIEFRYEWVSHTFLPQQIRPEVWEGSKQLGYGIKIVVNEEVRKQWSQSFFRTRADSIVSWERHDMDKDERWESPLQVIIYEKEQGGCEWEIFHHFMQLKWEQHQQLRSTVKSLEIEKVLQCLLEPR